MNVYVIVCSQTLKIYIGQHRGNDLQHYLQQKWSEAHGRREHGRSYLYNAMRKHPRESWSIWPLVSGIEDKKELDETEQLLIYTLKAQHPEVGYNLCDGGEGFTGRHSNLTKAKLSAASQAMWDNMTPEQKEIRLAQVREQGLKNHERMAGYKFGDDTKRKHAEISKRLSAEGKIPKGRAKGFRHSPETLAKMREAARRRLETSAGRVQILSAVQASAIARKTRLSFPIVEE